MRRSVRVAAAGLAGLLLLGSGLAACADGKKDPDTTASADASATMPAPTGGTVKVTGSTKEKPVVSMPKPFVVDKTTVNVISEGTGPTVKPNTLARVDYVGLNGTSSEEFDSSWKRNETAAFALTEGSAIKGFIDGIAGQKVGSRVEVSVPPADGYPQGNSDIGIAPTDTLVFVIDIRDTAPLLAKASGKAVAPENGFPAVTVKDGIPTAIAADKTLNSQKKTTSQVLIKGTGRTVEKGKYLSFQYIAASAKDGKVFDNSFASQPVPVPSLTDDLGIPGLAEALIGKKVGSRVEVIVPKALGSTTATPPPGVDKNDTVVFVVDVIGVV